MTANPEPEQTVAPWLQQLISEGKFRGLTLEEWPQFDLFESDEEADEFLDWLYRFRREGTI